MKNKIKNLDGVDKKDLEYLTNISSKLYKTRSIYSPTHGEGLAGDFTETKLEPKVIRKLMKIREKNGLIFYPTDGRFGFAPEYRIAYIENTAPGLSPEIIPLLRFEESQLPRSFNFKKLSEFWNAEDNLKKLEYAGINIEEKDAYYY